MLVKDLNRLPKWAQDEIRYLSNDRDAYKKRYNDAISGVGPDTNVHYQRWAEGSSDLINSGESEAIFKVGGEIISVKVVDLGIDKPVLEIYGSNCSLQAMPSSSNVMFVKGFHR